MGTTTSPGAKAFRNDAQRAVHRAEISLDEAKAKLARWQGVYDDALKREQSEAANKSAPPMMSDEEMTERTDPTDDDHEYVEYELDVKNGQVVGCRFFGEGREVDLLTEPVLFRPVDGDPNAPRLQHSLGLLARRILRALQKSVPANAE